MKDAARLLAYFALTLLLGAILAPLLFWGGQALASHRILPFLAAFDFESFFHRALMVAGILLIWPFLRSLQVRRLSDLGLAPDQRWLSHLLGGLLFAAIPLLCCGAALVVFHIYSLRVTFSARAVATILGASTVVPIIEELLFRGLILGILLRSGRKYLAMFVTSAFFSVLHFLKAPEHTSTVVTWMSGFNSIAHSFAQFSDPMLVAAAFTTLFLLGWILADTRLRTEALWLPIGLHAGWIFGNGLFNRLARRQVLALPWIGKNLLVGLVPLGVCGITWLLIVLWLNMRKNRRI
ncbi:MAG TPA: CPBP family intramembrane glutamic endopeptidase [Chthoniobacterales bacterium]